MLQNILKEKGLSVCSEPHYQWEKKKNPTLKDLGVYPRSQMRLRFDQGTTSDTEHFTMVTSEYGVVWVRLLCPKHISQTIVGIYDTKDFPVVSSKVIQKKGKFILETNGWNITKLVKEGVGRIGFLHVEEVKLNGDPYPNQAIYKHFGIPDLPEKPDLNKVK